MFPLLRFAALALATTRLSSAVTPIDAASVITPAHYFDLEGKALTFKPMRQGYAISITKVSDAGDRGDTLGKPDFPSGRSFGWRVNLPFPFLFGGRTWHAIFVNSAGNLTFERPEAELYPERDTWAHGTVQMVADSINNRAAAGHERMICALWGLNSRESRISVRSSPEEFVVTWQVERYSWLGEGYHSLGSNVFQAKLTPDGSIEFRYYKVSEKDGIVGLFAGGSDGRKLDAFQAPDDPPDPRMALASVESAFAGSVLRLTFVTKNGVLDRVPEGRLWYRVFLRHGQHSCEIGYAVTHDPKSAHAYLGEECEGTPGVRIEGNRLSLYVSNAMVQRFIEPGLVWVADTLWAKEPETLRHLAGRGAFHPSAEAWRPNLIPGYREGNIYSVYHYPQVIKDPRPLLRHIYSKVAAEDDLAVVLTDFRIDDLHNHQYSTGGGNGIGIQGIGSGLARVREDSAAKMGSPRLQVATGPIYPGPRFEEFLEDDTHHYKNYANAVGWMAHELGHRWGVQMEFRNPESGKNEPLHSSSSHWNDFMNTPSFASVWKMFSDAPYTEKSQMEGGVLHELPDGTFRREPRVWNMPTGFSALDLYAMGLIGADEVPDTFFLRNPKPLGPDLFSGQKVAVKIADVIAAMGERTPSVHDSQKEFALGMYLLHEGGRPVDAAKLRQAQAIEKSLIDYFALATAGRMRVVASHPTPRAVKQ